MAKINFETEKEWADAVRENPAILRDCPSEMKTLNVLTAALESDKKGAVRCVERYGEVTDTKMSSGEWGESFFKANKETDVNIEDIVDVGGIEASIRKVEQEQTHEYIPEEPKTEEDCVKAVRTNTDKDEQNINEQNGTDEEDIEL